MEPPGGIPGEGMRANPVAMEIPVNATGTRPGDGATKRELFSEETISVLLFPDGALIRLAAAVATGQLVFLTNKQTRKEVVCQVIGKRSYRPTSCYVELQFTEKMENFWGVEFPAEEVKAAPRPVAAAKAVETVAAVEDTEYVLEEPMAPPSEKEVEHLRNEVEMLRQQSEGKTAAEVLAVIEANSDTHSELAYELEPEAETEIELPTKPTAAPIVAAAPTGESTIGVAIPWPKEPEQIQVEFEREAASAARSSHVPMQLPSATGAERRTTDREVPKSGLPNAGSSKPELPKNDPEADLLDELLPRPALDFSKAPKQVVADGEGPYAIYKPERVKFGKWALGILALVLVGVLAIGARELGLLAQLRALTVRKTAPATAVVKQVAPTKTPDAGAKHATASETTGAANPGPTADVKAGADTASTDTAKKAGDASAVPAPPAVETEKRVVNTTNDLSSKNFAALKGKKKSVDADEHAGGTTDVSAVASDSPVVPAKLLRTVAPVYPPDAMRSFITGDVTLKAEVDEHGKVRKMEVMSGPTALRGAALEALKQYQYAAATRGGKGVSSEVRVTIKFWFDP
jgi:TonB family protein